MSNGIETHARTLAAAVREHRIVRNLTQIEAAAELRVSLRTFQAWESGRTFPQPSHRRVIASWLIDEDAA